MSMNKAAWLRKVTSPLEVDDAPMPIPEPYELVVRNRAVAINPLDTQMQGLGIYIQEWPAIFGCDVAGEVYAVGDAVSGIFRVGDRVIGHTINLTNGLPSHGAFALYTTLHADKAAHLPSSIPFSAGATIPTAFEAALCALCVHVQMHVINHVAVLGSASSLCGRGIPIPMLSLPYPALNPIPSGKIIFVHGAASSVGAMVVQVATAAGITVFATASERHHAMVRECGAVAVWDYHDKNKFVGEVVAAVRAVISSPKTATPPERKEKEKEKEKGNGNSKEPKFVGIVDAISQEDTYATDLEILGQLGSGWLACTHPPPTKLPENVRAGMIFGVNEVATPMWRGWVTPALEKGRLKCLPRARVVGKGLEFIQTALELYEKGVSGEKLVVEL